MAKGKYLSEKKKKLIASLYQNTNLIESRIAELVGVHRHTIYKYKNYKLKTITIKKGPSVAELKRIDPWDSQRQIMLNKLVSRYRKKFGNKVVQSDKYVVQNMVRSYLDNQIANERKTKFNDLPEYQNKDREDIIIDLTDIIFEILTHWE